MNIVATMHIKGKYDLASLVGKGPYSYALE